MEEKPEVKTILSRVREVINFTWIVFAIYLGLALYSYDKLDPGWSYVGTVQTVTNSAGRIGAWSADVMLTLLGIMAWMLPVGLVVKSVRNLRCQESSDKISIRLLLIRALGFILTVVSGAALTALHYHMLDKLFPVSSGGIIGQSLIEQFLPAFNVTGSTLLLLSTFLFGITLYTELSWLRLMDFFGYWSIRLAEYSKTHLTTLFWAVKTKVTNAIEKNRQNKPDAPTGSSRIKHEPELRLHQHCSVPDSVPMSMPTLIPEKPGLDLDDDTSPTISFDVIEENIKQRKENVSLPSRLPNAALLDEVRHSGKAMDVESLNAMSRLLELKLKDFNIDVKVVSVHPGPVITRFEIQPAPGIKASKISNLASDLARSLAVVSVRVVEIIPGKSVMGIEIPNEDRETVFFSEIISSESFEKAQSKISLALGHDISGKPVIVDLAKMPHLLVAGTTGSGKSVGLNAMVLSILFKSNPEDVRLIMIDPKMLELSIYDGIPHLLAPVVTDMKEAANALRWCVAEMERRYKLMAHMGVRNVASYNLKVKEALNKGEPLRDPFYQPVSTEDLAPELEKLPFIVVIVDEFADMMMIVGKKVEELIARIAQKARAAGIHLILATQRPSVDVITGLIKANVPTRISFQVSSKIDSRTIIDQGGAEQLLGHGDMLYLPPGTSIPIRIHGAFVSDDEVHRVVADCQAQGTPDFVEEILSGVVESNEGSAFVGGLDDDSEKDVLYDEAVAIVTESRRASISSVQRQLKVGYNRAARMIEAMEAAGIVSAALNNGNRDVIAPPPPKT